MRVWRLPVMRTMADEGAAAVELGAVGRAQGVAADPHDRLGRQADHAGGQWAGVRAVVAEADVQDAVAGLADGAGGTKLVRLQEFAVEVVLLDAVAGQVGEPDGVAAELQVLVPGVGGVQRIPEA